MTEHRKRKKHRKVKTWHIVLAIVLVVLICAGIVALKNLDNIRAVYEAKKLTAEEIVIKQNENKQKTQEILDSITEAEISELPEDVREMLKEGEITEEESIEIILGNATVEEIIERNSASGEAPSGEKKPQEEKPQENKPAVEKPQENKPTEEKPNNASKKEEIIAKIYLLRAEYLNAIDGLIESGKATLRTIKPSEWTTSKKMSLISEYGAKGEALEASCDARMEALLGELEAELSRLGESTAPVGEIRSAYKEQKILKKEELFSMYYPD